MKRLIAVLLALSLMTIMPLWAYADGSAYPTTLLRKVSWTPDELTGNASYRAVTCALLLTDYYLGSGDDGILSQVQASDGTSFIAKYDDSVDVYLSVGEQQYRNLFYEPDTGLLTDMGLTGNGPASEEYTYYPVNNAQIYKATQALSDYLSE